MTDLDTLRAKLEEHGQAHTLAFVDTLDAATRAAFLTELDAFDWARLRRLVDQALAEPDTADEAPLEPPPVVEWGTDDARDEAARAAGQAALRAGKVGAFLVAGGQGTRLGYDGPKGRYPVGPITNRSLFAYHAQRVLAACRRYDATLPLYVMTSRVNHESTVAAFEEANWFGLDPEQVMLFQQGMLPAVDADGRVLLADKGQLALSPDGHGGCFRALQVSGALDDMRVRGVEQLFYFQVDNPLAQVFDPLFIGHHLQGRAEMSTKVVEKREAGEKVGVLARRGGQNVLVEYSDLDASLAEAREPDGRLRYRAGNIAIHVLDRAFVERIASGGIELPVHKAHKKVPHVDADGQLVSPDAPNAIKLEMFVFDALQYAERVVNQIVKREDEFAPVKNATGNDSPETSRAALTDQARRWMTAAGLSLPEGPVEVGPLFALDQDEFLANLTRADYGPVFDRS